MKTKTAIMAVIVICFLIGTAPDVTRAGLKSKPFQSEINKIESVEQNLDVCRKQLDNILDELLVAKKPGNNLNESLNKLDALANKLGVLENRVGDIVDDVVSAHLQDSSLPLTPVKTAMERVQSKVQGIADAILQFIEKTGFDVITPELRQAIEGIRDRLKESILADGFRYYRRYIPVRFVQFVDAESQILSDQILQYNIDQTNKIFSPARIRYFMRTSISVFASEFTNPYRKDQEGKLHHELYTWPDEIWRSPLIWPLYWPQLANCEVLGISDNRTESRYNAQMRAGTYCCPEDELLVYINQGRSNGGQYPWHARIIGMTGGHMARPNQKSFVFPHEVGHYLGLPHTFPGHQTYSTDWDLAAMIGSKVGEDPSPDLRRYYHTHASLVDVETGGTAGLSMFWDLVFAPTYNIATQSRQYFFFNSREEAAAWEEILQPIEQWGNGAYCFQTDGCCGLISKAIQLRLSVGAGCRGVRGDYSDCEWPAMDHCTGNPEVRAFSRYGSTPNKIQINVMSYGYQMIDGSNEPSDMVEMNFISESQIEQIERVLNHDHDIESFFFPGGYGKRPLLGISIQ
jgi:hypothetical protein